MQSTCGGMLKGQRLQSSTRLVLRPLCSWRWQVVCCPWRHRSYPAKGRWSCWSKKKSTRKDFKSVVNCLNTWLYQPTNSQKLYISWLKAIKANSHTSILNSTKPWSYVCYHSVNGRCTRVHFNTLSMQIQDRHGSYQSSVTNTFLYTVHFLGL